MYKTSLLTDSQAFLRTTNSSCTVSLSYNFFPYLRNCKQSYQQLASIILSTYLLNFKGIMGDISYKADNSNMPKIIAVGYFYHLVKTYKNRLLLLFW